MRTLRDFTIGLVLACAAGFTITSFVWATQTSAPNMSAAIVDRFITIGGITEIGKLGIKDESTTQDSIHVDGIASKTGDFQEFDNSSGTVLFQITSTGLVRAVNGIQLNDSAIRDGGTLGATTGTFSSRVYVTTGIVDAGSLSVAVSPIRMSSNVCHMVGAGRPVDATTGDNNCAKASQYYQTDASSDEGMVWTNVGTVTAPVWEPTCHHR